MGWNSPCWYRIGRWCFDAMGDDFAQVLWVTFPWGVPMDQPLCPCWFAQQCPRAGAVSVPGCLVQPHEPAAAQMVTTSSGEQTSKSTFLPSPTEPVASGEPVKGGFLTTGLKSSYNFNNWFLWARPNCLWHLTETCLRRITQCTVDSALPSGMFGCECQTCCSARTGAWLMSYPSAAAGKSLLIHSFSKDNHLPL